MGIPSDILSERSGAFAEELRVATRLAHEAGDIALQYHGEDISVDLKIGDEPVTVADHECSAHIVAGLREAFPGDVVISEEVADDSRRIQAERVWYVDPIDGTKAFIRGENSYCVMIGLTLRHRPVVGVVLQPNYQTFLFAAKDAGAWLIREERCSQLSTSDRQRPEEARHLRPKNTIAADWGAITAELGLPPDKKISSIGLKLCTIALGASDLHVNPYTNSSSWDTCAPQVILEEAGGQISDMHGLALRYDDPETSKHRRGLIASNGRMHEKVIQKLAELYPDPGPE
jgi:3'(2'), 5'-bisphosphate nucleotidase